MPFSNIIGQQDIISRLRRTLRAKRLAHGYLFIGGEGSGREQVALALGQALLCESPIDEDACGQCASCKKVASGNHADLQLVLSEAKQVQRALIKQDGKRNPSQEIRLDAVKELSRRLRMRSYEGRGQVGIVVDAHRLRLEAANALLKTLEEPAPGTLLILIAPGPRAVLDTLRSRCQLLRFTPLADAEIAAQLQSQHALPAEQAQGIAARAEGSMSRAIELIEAGFAENLELSRDFLHALATGNLAKAMDDAADMARDRITALAQLAELQQLLHQRLLIYGKNQDALGIRKMAEAFAASQKSERALRGNSMPQLTIEALAATLLPLLQANREQA